MRPEAAVLRRWKADPVAFVRECFKVEPDPWQIDVLAAFPQHMRIAMKACKGPGKTCVLAWLAWNFMLTRPDAKVIATSISEDNLSDGLWSEMAKWLYEEKTNKALQDQFVWRKTQIEHKGSPATWFMAARTWSKSADKNAQSNTLAGKHADNMLFILDEVGGIPDAVMATAEAGLANAGIDGREAHLVIAGNPTHLDGPLYRACTTERAMWHVTEITSDPDDPKRTPRVSKDWARQQIEKYGRDNPWVLVNVFGRFPPSSLNSLLGPDEVREAMRRHKRDEDFRHAPKILGVDVAREGDDCSVIFPRQGVAAFTPIVLRNVDSLQGAGRLAVKWREWEADACFVDNSGGFGGGWIDQLRALQRQPIGVHFAGKPNDERYLNKRAEMWFLMAQWIKEGGAIPEIPELVGELTVPTYTFKGDRFMIEPKEQIKERLQRSPDLADALALTFAQPVHKVQPDAPWVRPFVIPDHNPYARSRR